MARLVVLDASVVIAFRDPADALHQRAVTALQAHAADELVLPASAYAEILVGPLRHGPAAVDALDRFLGDLAVRIEPLTPTIARRAAVLRAGTRAVRLPDALVLATADALDASAVLTGVAAWPALSARAHLI